MLERGEAMFWILIHQTKDLNTMLNAANIEMFNALHNCLKSIEFFTPVAKEIHYITRKVFHRC